MLRLNKFLRLSSTERRLLVNSICLVTAVRLGLWLLPFQHLRRLLASWAKPVSPLNGVDPTFVGRVVWAVTVASRFVPRATCLTQALTTKVLLARRGHWAVLRVGVTRSERSEFLAHAWIEINGKTIIGGSDSFVKRYTSLPLLDDEII
jgi:hypothetical protein